MGLMDMGIEREKKYNPLEDLMKKRDLDYGYDNIEEDEKDFFIQFLQFLRDKRESTKERYREVA